jgi:hypothetical protein
MRAGILCLLVAEEMVAELIVCEENQPSYSVSGHTASYTTLKVV